MRVPFLVLVCVSSLFAAAGDFTFKQKNSFLVHPLALVAIPFEYAFVELDYTHNFNNGLTLLVRPLYYEGPSDWFGWDTEGDRWCASLESGIKRPFYLAGIENLRFGVYPQVTLTGGYIQKYYRNTETDIVYEDYEGYFAGLTNTFGLLFQVKRFILSADIGVRWNFYRPDGNDESLILAPNVALGFMF